MQIFDLIMTPVKMHETRLNYTPITFKFHRPKWEGRTVKNEKSCLMDHLVNISTYKQKYIYI